MGCRKIVARREAPGVGDVRHFVEDLLARSLPVLFSRLRVRIDDLVDELAHFLLELAVVLFGG